MFTRLRSRMPLSLVVHSGDGNHRACPAHSDGLTTAVVVFVLVGFPIALVISWAFEMTPEGMKRTAEVSTEDVRGSPTGVKRNSPASSLVQSLSLLDCSRFNYCEQNRQS